MSLQLEALAEEVFAAAVAQARIAGQSKRFPFGEAIWNPTYPDLFFLNAIVDLCAAEWSAGQFEQVVREIMPEAQRLRAASRDPRTVAGLGPRLVAAGYVHEVRVGMVQVTFPSAPSSPLGNGLAGAYAVLPVDTPISWSAFEESLRIDGEEHGWARSMIEQFIALCRHSAADSPTRYFLAWQAQRPVAHIGLFQHGSTGYLHALYTRPESRHRGAASALVAAMSAEARAIGCDRLTLQCSDDGYLPRFYARLGFRPVGEQHIWTKST